MTYREARRIHICEIVRDLKRMKRIDQDVAWLLGRDSNVSTAASLCDGIKVLIEKAQELHREEMEMWKSRKSWKGWGSESDGCLR